MVSKRNERIKMFGRKKLLGKEIYKKYTKYVDEFTENKEDKYDLEIRKRKNFRENQNFINLLKEDNFSNINIKYIDIGAPLNNWGSPVDESKKKIGKNIRNLY